MKRLIFGFLIAVMGMPLLAMQEVNRDEQLLDAVRSRVFKDVEGLLAEGKGQFSSAALQKALWLAALFFNMNLCRLLIANGANIRGFDVLASDDQWPLRRAVENNDINMIKFLIENGANLDVQSSSHSTALMFAHNCEVVEAVSTTLPLIERIKILEAKIAVILAHKLALKQGLSISQRDVRKIITREFITRLVDLQMLRVKKLLEMRDSFNMTSYQLLSVLMQDAECVNWNNPATRASLRHGLETNIRNILFSPEESVEKAK